jgi:xylan 1,4-beta-xylosidase
LSTDVFGTTETIPRNRMVCKAAKKVHDQVKSSEKPDLPIFFSEYNASYKNEPEVTDSEFMGPWLADTIRQCDGLMGILSYWTFSDVFEEQGVVQQPFYGGFGLIAAGGIAKPSFNAFKLLHKLGEQRIESQSDSALVTKRSDGTVVMAVWNQWLPEESGKSKEVTIKLLGRTGNLHAAIYRLDTIHGSALQRYSEMGKPTDPTRKELDELRRSAELPPAETKSLTRGEIKITLPPQGLAVIEFRP